jgi:N-acetylmuramoyl-L-alanine amidase
MASPRTAWLVGLMATLLGACAPTPQRAGIPTEWRPSPNFNERRPHLVILHHTGSDTAERALRTLSSPALAVSAHYLVGRDGTVFQLVDERSRAWHAGAARWGAITDLNSSSLGIELVNDGEEPYTEPQIASLLRLLADIRQRYRIPAANFIGHADVAPRRKVDPGRNFPWKRLAEQGFGLWCEAPLAPPPSPFDAVAALQALGYDTVDAEAAIGAFKLHFAPDRSAPLLDDADAALLHCLLQKRAGQEAPRAAREAQSD